MAEVKQIGCQHVGSDFPSLIPCTLVDCNTNLNRFKLPDYNKTGSQSLLYASILDAI